MIYPIVIYGSQILRNKSENITPDYPELKKLIEDMFLTLDEAEGVGLAAPQIGKNIRLFIVSREHKAFSAADSLSLAPASGYGSLKSNRKESVVAIAKSLPLRETFSSTRLFDHWG